MFVSNRLKSLRGSIRRCISRFFATFTMPSPHFTIPFTTLLPMQTSRSTQGEVLEALSTYL